MDNVLIPDPRLALSLFTLINLAELSRRFTKEGFAKKKMEVSTLVLTVLIPILACSVYYCHHLKQQLAAYKSETAEASHVPDRGRRPVRGSQDWKVYLEEWGSGAWCQGSSNVDRRCIFHNLCYHTEHQDFVFLHTSHSINEGIPDDRQRPAIADLSSVSDHNTQYFGYVDAPSAAVWSVKNVSYLEGKYLLFNRFNAGNLMHAIHDDLLPLFYTQLQLGLLNLQSGVKHATLLMSDGEDEEPYFGLYEHISKTTPVLAHKLSDRDSSRLVCFEEVHVGLSKFTTWYQYGFDVPQGPLDNMGVTAKEIKLFTSFYKSRLKIPDCVPSAEAENKNMFVILSRRTNRLILNEVELSLALAQHFDAFVVVASLETHSLPELIELISCSKGMVAVHGSLLSLSIFLPPAAVLVEIFPYAVNPDNYTPYRTLAHLKGMNIAYRAWRNVDESNTVTHPEAEPELGGIAHLEDQLQEQISSSPEVPPHLCCNDAAWLFRIYQDTRVDVDRFMEVVKDALLESQVKTEEPKIGKESYQPGAVQHVSCFTVPLTSQDATIKDNDDEVVLLLSWQPPWNIHYIQNSMNGDEGNSDKVEYEVTIQEQGEGELYSGAFILPVTSHLFQEGFKKCHVYFAWIRCKAGGKTGPYAAITSCPYRVE